MSDLRPYDLATLFAITPAHKMEFDYVVGCVLPDYAFPAIEGYLPFLVLGYSPKDGGNDFHRTWFVTNAKLDTQWAGEERYGLSRGMLRVNRCSLYKSIQPDEHRITRYIKKDGEWAELNLFTINWDATTVGKTEVEPLPADGIEYCKKVLAMGEALNPDILFAGMPHLPTVKSSSPASFDWVEGHLRKVGALPKEEWGSAVLSDGESGKTNKEQEGISGVGSKKVSDSGLTAGRSRILPKTREYEQLVELRDTARRLYYTNCIEPFKDRLVNKNLPDTVLFKEIVAFVQTNISALPTQYIHQEVGICFEDLPKDYFSIDFDILKKMSITDVIDYFRGDYPVVYVYLILKFANKLNKDFDFKPVLGDSVSGFSLRDCDGLGIAPHLKLGVHSADALLLYLKKAGVSDEDFNYDFSLRFRPLGLIDEAWSRTMSPNSVWRSTSSLRSAVTKVLDMPMFRHPFGEGMTAQTVMDSAVAMGGLVLYKTNSVRYLSLMKEIAIIDFMYGMYEDFDEPDNSVIEDLDEVANRFEGGKSQELGFDFRLEERQRDAIKASYLPLVAVTGGAGSGKTTTVEGIIEGVKHLYDYSDDEIAFLAPTGKAASRLSEVVKTEAKTIHSYFRILPNGKKVETDAESVIARCIVIDESSMINLDLMYAIVSALEGSEIETLIFIGDIKQLTPIGEGKPYASLLSYIPTVVLNVSKRASEGSLITRNANTIAGGSSAIEEGEDFEVYEVPEESIEERVLSECKSIMAGGAEADDIQVMTPLNKRVWGSTNLNHKLKSVFNPIKSGDYIICRNKRVDLGAGVSSIDVEFTIGDRVIHLVNKPETPHYIKDGDGYKINEGIKGIMNGTVGRIIDILPYRDLKMDVKPTQLSNALYVLVEYSVGDYVYYVVYTARVSPQSQTFFLYEGGNFRDLDLAYALTVHKLQGSQAKHAVVVAYKVGNFVSRNMLYTAITRASKTCVYMGSVDAIKNGVGVDETKKVSCLTELIF